ncbi:hypothetical protein D8666_12010 [Ochrobactrum soli]|nr:hypothetical protein D8666_12010 [[Ochrobactrum] soli]
MFLATIRGGRLQLQRGAALLHVQISLRQAARLFSSFSHVEIRQMTYGVSSGFVVLCVKIVHVTCTVVSVFGELLARPAEEGI